MVWNTPRTWVDGEVETVQIINAHLRDNLSLLEQSQAAAAGDILVASGAHTFTRVAKGADGQILVAPRSGTVPEWMGVTLLLGRTVYNPVALTAATTSSTTFADVDATNLTVTFTAPGSGAVAVELCGLGPASTAAPFVSWNVRDSGGDVAGTGARVGGVPAVTSSFRVAHIAIVTGLTAGTSYTWKWGAKASTASSTTTVTYGGAAGEAVMSVWQA